MSIKHIVSFSGGMGSFAEAKAVYDSVGKTFPFIVKTVGGVKNYITLRQYRETYLETDSVTQAESQEFGGCGCAI
jgi:hypothetical protein